MNKDIFLTNSYGGKKQKFQPIDENNIKIKNIVLVYVDAKTNEIINKLKGRKNFNKKTYKIMAKNQLPSVYKKRRCNFVIRNNFKKEFVIKQINELKVKLGI